ncbi:MAG: hypothetical protein JOZ08_05420 [Verrucomicrobia bacterium]|nr:hypothetical protein [Verrucomicrobiota bacterium]
MGFQKKDDAERVYQVLPRRFEKYGLKINLEKTRVVRFTRPGSRKHQGKAKAETFDFLGFTHYWGRSRKGQWFVMHKTATSGKNAHSSHFPAIKMRIRLEAERDRGQSHGCRGSAGRRDPPGRNRRAQVY